MTCHFNESLLKKQTNSHKCTHRFRAKRNKKSTQLGEEIESNCKLAVYHLKHFCYSNIYSREMLCQEMCRRSHLNIEQTTNCSFAILCRKKNTKSNITLYDLRKRSTMLYTSHGCLAFCSKLFMGVLCICHELTTSQMINDLPHIDCFSS